MALETCFGIVREEEKGKEREHAYTTEQDQR